MEKLKSNEEYLKEARKDIEKEIKNIHKGSDFDDFLKDENIYEEVIEAAINELETNRKKIKNMTQVQLAEWLIEKHEEFVETLNAMFKCDAMDPQDFDDRCLKILYINELNTLLHVHEIEEITKEMTDVMESKNCVDLLVVLHVLGFI